MGRRFESPDPDLLHSAAGQIAAIRVVADKTATGLVIRVEGEGREPVVVSLNE